MGMSRQRLRQRDMICFDSISYNGLTHDWLTIAYVQTLLIQAPPNVCGSTDWQACDGKQNAELVKEKKIFGLIKKGRCQKGKGWLY